MFSLSLVLVFSCLTHYCDQHKKAAFVVLRRFTNALITVVCPTKGAMEVAGLAFGVISTIDVCIR